jgi:hypothetical protein
MKHLLAILLVFAISVPAPLYAGPLKELLTDQPELELVPKLQLEMCENKKCLDMENYKLYLQMRVQYTWLFKVHTNLMPVVLEELKNSAALYAEAEKTQEARALRSEKHADKLLAQYVLAVQEAEQAKGHSVWGGGLPWLFTALAVGLAGGVALTIWIKP